VTHPETKRFALLVHYDGSLFHGWQLQAGVSTVQGALEEVLLRLTGTRRPVVGSGRTDRGVHASGQVASVDLPLGWSAERLERALNALLPRSIWVERVQEAHPNFHPRFQAIRRTYVYYVGLHPRCRSPFLRGRCWASETSPPDLELLQAGAELIPGSRSFRRFSKAGQPERGEICEVFSASWQGWAGEVAVLQESSPPSLGLRFSISADRYLHHMVRYLVGTLMEVGRGGRPLADLETLLQDPETPLRTSPPAPPEGLFLARVEYPTGLGFDSAPADPHPLFLSFGAATPE